MTINKKDISITKAYCKFCKGELVLGEKSAHEICIDSMANSFVNRKIMKNTVQYEKNIKDSLNLFLKKSFGLKIHDLSILYGIHYKNNRIHAFEAYSKNDYHNFFQFKKPKFEKKFYGKITHQFRQINIEHLNYEEFPWTLAIWKTCGKKDCSAETSYFCYNCNLPYCKRHFKKNPLNKCKECMEKWIRE